MTTLRDRMRDRLIYSHAVGRAALQPLARWGYSRYLATGTTPKSAYVAMRKLYGNTNASLFDRLSAQVAPDGGENGESSGPGVAESEVDAVVERLRRDGYAVLENLLPPAECDELEAVARSAACSVIGPDGPLPGRRRFDPEDLVAIRYDLDEDDIVQSAAAQRLIVDRSLLAVAGRYLGASPVQDLVAMWWSAAVDSSVSASGTAAAAQQFHFDLDRLRFLKVFVFLTDVDDRTGPHVYVRGTHGNVDQPFRKDGRYADDCVLPVFGDDVRKITGPRGTVFLADTRGLHKGMNLETGHRLVFQTEYATSLFGAHYNRPRVRAAIPEFVAMTRSHPETFRRFEVTPVDGD